MKEGQPLSVSATIDCLLTLMLRSLLAGGVIARRDESEGRENEENKKRKDRQACSGKSPVM